MLADNIVATLRGQALKNYEHKYAGSVAGLGLRKGVANVYGVKLKGWPAWMMHRAYHMSRVPTLRRKIEVQTDWAAALLFRRDVVSLGSLQRPRREFTEFAPRPKAAEMPADTPAQATPTTPTPEPAAAVSGAGGSGQ